jgi:hypothetical protein
MKEIFTPKLKGYFFANAFAFILMGMSKVLFTPIGGSGVLIFSEFIIIPVLMGIISAWYWKNLQLRGKTLTWYSCLNGFIAILLSFVFLGEGFICLIIVSPLIFCFVIAGAFLGRSMFNRNDTTLNVSVLALLIFIFVTDSLSKHQYENMVSDTIIINAPPAKVWNNVVAFEPIQQKNNFWLFRIGMPSPMATTVTGHYNGAGRKCIFSNGYTFGEKIVTYDENANLTFNIIDQPRDPEIMGHIDIERGQFLLKDNGNGTTTLTGNSWYKLYVFPVWYYDIWAQSITRNVHFRVMEHIKQISERQ